MSKKKSVSKTGAQQNQGVASYVGADESALGRASGVLTYDESRAIRRHPTIALARAFLGAVIVQGSWSYESDDDVDDEVLESVRSVFDPLRREYVRTAVFNEIDYGWSPYEVVWAWDETRGLQVVERLKSLLVDITTVLVERGGAFAGLRNIAPGTGEVKLTEDSALVVTLDKEGDYHYGESLLECARGPYDSWVEADRGAKKFDKKVAGSHFVVYYPPGTSSYNGTETDNFEIAQALLKSIEASGAVTVPQIEQQYADQAEALGWKIELLSSQQQQASFKDRLGYLDALMCRAMRVPERAMMEGQYGTKAEAGVHASLMITCAQVLDRDLAEVLKRIVDAFLEVNYGPDARGKVRVVPAPLVDAQVAFLQQLYQALLANPSLSAYEVSAIDTDALKDRIGVPKSKEVAASDAQAGEGEGDEEILEGTAEALAASLNVGEPARTEAGTWTRDGSGIAARYGADYADIDEALASAGKSASEGKFDDARAALYGIRRVTDGRVRYALNRRVVAVLNRMLRLEQRALRFSTEESIT